MQAIDGKKDTYFALKGGIEDGYWQSYFTIPGSKVTRVEVTSATDHEDEASEAMVYVGDNKIGTLPKDVKKSKRYCFTCDAVGDFVHIVTGRKDMKLTLAYVEVYGVSNELGE